MRILHDGTDLDGFFETLEERDSGVLLLDYDGTLAPFHEDRDAARPYAGVRERIERLGEPGGRDGGRGPVIVSGRPSAEVRRLLDVDPSPEIWGCHGWERLDPTGELHVVDPGSGVRDDLKRAHERARALAPEGRAEHKGAAVAVHVRGMDPAAARRLASSIETEWSAIAAGRDGLELRPFDGGLELRAGARDKGSAVGDILAGLPDGLSVAYLGDDLTDEDAFRAVREVGGLAVLVRPEPRASEANVWLRPPDELLDFLDRWIRALSGSGEDGSGDPMDVH